MQSKVRSLLRTGLFRTQKKSPDGRRGLRPAAHVAVDLRRKVVHSSDCLGPVPDLEYLLISLRDKCPEDLLSFREEADEMLTYMQKEFRKTRKEGREEGLEKGREKGQLEMGISIALAMLEAGEPEEKILRYTGFAPAQLAEIREGRKQD